MRKTHFGLACVCLVALFMAGCGENRKTKDLNETMRLYGKLIRWNEFEEALKYREPEYAKQHPVSDGFRDFLTHITVTGYTEKQGGMDPDGVSAYQVVEVRYYNDLYARERVIVNRQIWRYDDEAERWWLYGDLPDFAAK